MAGSRRTMALRRAIAWTPTASVIVSTRREAFGDCRHGEADDRHEQVRKGHASHEIAIGQQRGGDDEDETVSQRANRSICATRASSAAQRGRASR